MSPQHRKPPVIITPTYELPDCLSRPAEEAPTGRGEGGQHGLTSLSPGGLYVTWQGPWPWRPAASGRLCRLSSSHPSQTEGPSLLPPAGLAVTTAGRSNKPLCPRAPGWVPAGSTLLEGGQ